MTEDVGEGRILRLKNWVRRLEGWVLGRISHLHQEFTEIAAVDDFGLSLIRIDK
jgi:hypothetical protein